MLVIKKLGWLNDYGEEEDRDYIWHLGQSVPQTSRVVTLQVDGDELNLILDAMELTTGYKRGIGYSKQKGFHFPFEGREIK